jgi:hypothetical protein
MPDEEQPIAGEQCFCLFVVIGKTPRPRRSLQVAPALEVLANHRELVDGELRKPCRILDVLITRLLIRQALGWEDYDCDPNYRESDGETSRYWKQDRYDCPEFNNPLLPACELCTKYTTSDGHSFTSCTAAACPLTSW